MKYNQNWMMNEDFEKKLGGGHNNPIVSLKIGTLFHSSPKLDQTGVFLRIQEIQLFFAQIFII